MAHRELQGRLEIAKQQAHMYQQAIAHLMAPPSNDQFMSARENVFADLLENADSSTAAAAYEPESREGYDDGVAISWEGSVDTSSGRSEALSDGENGAAEPSGVSSFSDVLHVMASRSRSELAVNASSKADAAEVAWWIGTSDAGKVDKMSKSKRLEEFHRLTDELDMAKRRRGVVCEEREALARRTAQLSRCRGQLLSRGIQLDGMRTDISNARESCRVRRTLYSEQLVSAMNMGALNDAFHIWHRGPFATINGFRVGRLPTVLVDWQEVNAGIGQAALVLVTVAMAMGVEFSKYLITPCGSFTKIARSDNGRVLYSLHTDESFSLFPRRNFNLALKAFLHCLGEVGEHVQEHDPTLRLPYRIKDKDGTVGGLPVSLGSSPEDWTRALKYMMTNLKWITAWAAKHLPPV